MLKNTFRNEHGESSCTNDDEMAMDISIIKKEMHKWGYAYLLSSTIIILEALVVVFMVFRESVVEIGRIGVFPVIGSMVRYAVIGFLLLLTIWLNRRSRKNYEDCIRLRFAYGYKVFVLKHVRSILDGDVGESDSDGQKLRIRTREKTVDFMIESLSEDPTRQLYE